MDLGPVETIAVNYFVPYYVNDVQSDIRGVKCGWYTTSAASFVPGHF